MVYDRHMIPYAVIMMKLVLKDGTPLETRVLESVGHGGVLFRVPAEWDAWMGQVEETGFHFLRYAERRYETVSVRAFTLLQAPEREEPGAADGHYYRLTTGDVTFRGALTRCLADYDRYIDCKLNLEEQELFTALTGEKVAEEYPESLGAWKQAEVEDAKAWWRVEEGPHPALRATFPDERGRLLEAFHWPYGYRLPEGLELAVVLDGPAMWGQYLDMDREDFLRRYWQENALSGHPLARARVTHLYIGSQFCPLAQPDDTTLAALLEKAAADGFVPVVAFSTMPEHLADRVRERLLLLARRCTERDERMELVLNDIGEAVLLKALVENGTIPADTFVLTAGILLNRRKKDPRMALCPHGKLDRGAAALSSLDAPFYARFLKNRYGFAGFSYESVACPEQYPAGHHCLHLPLYQTNTSDCCTLAAAVTRGERGMQEKMTACPGHCADHVFYYPGAFHMMGIGNSLFGFDGRGLVDTAWLYRQLQGGIHRLVVRL